MLKKSNEINMVLYAFVNKNSMVVFSICGKLTMESTITKNDVTEHVI